MERKHESDYIRQIIDGNTELFSIFVKRYTNSVLGLIRQIVVSAEDAEELTQDAFVKAFTKLNTFKGDCSFSTWIYRIAYNTAISFIRKKKIVFPSLDEYIINNVPDEVVNNFFDTDIEEEKMQRLSEAINRLPAQEKTILLLFYEEDKPVAEIASIVDISVENVKVRLHRIRKKLFVLMTEQ